MSRTVDYHGNSQQRRRGDNGVAVRRATIRDMRFADRRTHPFDVRLHKLFMLYGTDSNDYEETNHPLLTSGIFEAPLRKQQE